MSIEIVQDEPRLTPSQALEALKIAHETKDPAVKAAALLLLNPGFVVMREPYKLPDLVAAWGVSPWPGDAS